jgi:multidrug efflux pump
MTSSWWVNLSTAMVFGLAFATILTLIFCPVMLSAPEVWRQGIRRLRTRFRRRRTTNGDGKPSAAPEAANDTEPEAFPEAAE